MDREKGVEYKLLKAKHIKVTLLEGTVPTYEAYIALKKVLINRN